MKRVIFFRHGKAEAHSSEMKDFDRALVQRGKDEVKLNASILKKTISIDLIVSSPAKRAFETASIISKVNDHTNIVIEDALYDATIKNLLYILNTLSEEYNTVLLTGHNPTFEYAVDFFSGSEYNRLRTSDAAVIEFPFETWSMISEGTGTILKRIQRD
jgi:phosphohistidine phosphatase